MSFDSIADFFAMGGHYLYVWLAYGAAAGVITWNLLAPIRAHRRFFVMESQRARREGARPERAPNGRIGD